MKKILKQIIVIAGVVLITAFLLMAIGNKMRADAIKEQHAEENYSSWLAENCKCLERNIIFCPEGFILKNQSCVNEQEKTFTNKLAGCSKYDCSGEIKLWNNETNKWSQ